MMRCECCGQRELVFVEMERMTRDGNPLPSYESCEGCAGAECDAVCKRELCPNCGERDVTSAGSCTECLTQEKL